ncbi:MAG: DUF4301 family protein [Mangrovibacterium sp.]
MKRRYNAYISRENRNANFMFTEKDLVFIKERGSNETTVKTQVENFKKGFPFLPIVAPAAVGNGIIQLNSEEIESFIHTYEDKINDGLKPLKFVPASGAASRMFKTLFSAKDELESGIDEQEVLSNNKDIAQFRTQIKDFAFYEDLSSIAGKPAEDLTLLEKLNFLLTENGLNYGALPKGLLKFHNYDDTNRSSFEEHCVEGAAYAMDSNGKVSIHFTVSPEHQAKFEEHLADKLAYHSEQFKANYTISFSCQKSETDTIAVTPDNRPFRTDDGNVLFRPAGHGALIANLNELDADIIFIKNIDNVVPDHLKPETVRYKKALAGLLLDIQKVVYTYQQKFDQYTEAEFTEEFINKAILFLGKSLNTRMPKTIDNKSDKIAYLKAKFNRPLRVCGMVKNEGEPGGGPFWASSADGSVSLQVLESSQIDFNDAKQSEFANLATHFNPVDLICATKNYKGESFNLMNYVDPATGFISNKSLNGKELKAQELPGLWNGAMSDWNTLFVEVPILTFNPVKTVNDLLRKEHQSTK